MTTALAARDLGSAGRLTRRPLAELMAVPAPILSRDTPVTHAIAAMAQHRLRHAAVVDRRGRCVGVTSHRLLLTRWAADRVAGGRLTVGDTLSATPAMLPSNCVVSDAARLMRRCGAESVALADQLGRPVGLITKDDLIGLLTEVGGLPCCSMT